MLSPVTASAGDTGPADVSNHGIQGCSGSPAPEGLRALTYASQLSPSAPRAVMQLELRLQEKHEECRGHLDVVGARHLPACVTVVVLDEICLSDVPFWL